MILVNMMNKNKAKAGQQSFTSSGGPSFSKQEQHMAQSRLIEASEPGSELKFPKFESMIHDRTQLLNKSPEKPGDLSDMSIRQGDLSGISTDYGSKHNQDLIQEKEKKILNMRSRNFSLVICRAEGA